MIVLFIPMSTRNAACLGGNLATASPISDVNPLLMASNTKVRQQLNLAELNLTHTQITLASVSGTREVNVRDFFTGYVIHHIFGAILRVLCMVTATEQL